MLWKEGREGRRDGGKERKRKEEGREGGPDTKGTSRTGWRTMNGSTLFYIVLIFELDKEFTYFFKKLK